MRRNFDIPLFFVGDTRPPVVERSGVRRRCGPRTITIAEAPVVVFGV